MKVIYQPLVMACALTLGLYANSWAGVSVEEAASLGADLTPLGAEKAGNADGSIPVWKGCPDFDNMPLDKISSGDRRWDPYADEQPLYSVTADNMAQYESLLTDGVKALLQKYPNAMRLDVYPTHRNHCAPSWVYEATKNNATQASLVTEGTDDGVVGAINGIPFPIPQNGAEVRWNSNLRWRGLSYESKVRQFSMTTSGDRVLGSQSHQMDQMEYYRKGLTAEEHEAEGYPYWFFLQFTNAPSFRAGEGLVARFPSNYVAEKRKVWQYLVGQRRVRRSPNVGWDTPDFVNSGANFFDEVFGNPHGEDERYDYRLVGKKELLIPYNNNKVFSLDEDGLFMANHHNPDAIRWEKHRVWVLEATLKPGARHAVSKRMIYVDEDTWGTALYDGWDPAGNLWRVSINLSYYLPDMPGQISSYSDILYVLDAAWSSRNTVFFEPGYQLKAVEMKPESIFTPESLAGQGVR